MVHGNDDSVLQHFQTDRLTQQAHTNPGNQSPDAPPIRTLCDWQPAPPMRGAQGRGVCVPPMGGAQGRGEESTRGEADSTGRISAVTWRQGKEEEEEEEEEEEGVFSAAIVSEDSDDGKKELGGDGRCCWPSTASLERLDESLSESRCESFSIHTLKRSSVCRCITAKRVMASSRTLPMPFLSHELWMLPVRSVLIVLLPPEVSSSSSSEELVLESHVSSLSLVLLSCSRLYFFRAAASRFCLSKRILSLCFWLRLPLVCFSGPPAATTVGWQRFFFADSAFCGISLSERNRRAFLPPVAEEDDCFPVACPSFVVSMFPSSSFPVEGVAPSSPEESVSESARCPLEEGDIMQGFEEDAGLSLPVEACWESGESLRSSFIRHGMERRLSSPSVFKGLSASFSLGGELVLVVVSVFRCSSWAEPVVDCASSRHSVGDSASTKSSALSESAIFMLVEPKAQRSSEHGPMCLDRSSPAVRETNHSFKFTVKESGCLTAQAT
ncbi:hypothetical protein F7725_015134, partial [Dissostichus mawsoni]